MNNDNTKKTTMRTKILSDAITEHSQKIAALKPDERFDVTYILGGPDVTQVEGSISKISKIKVD